MLPPRKCSKAQYFKRKCPKKSQKMTKQQKFEGKMIVQYFSLKNRHGLEKMVSQYVRSTLPFVMLYTVN